MFSKIGFLKISQYRQENNCLESLFNTVACRLVEGTPTHMFSCEYCKSFKNSFFHRPHPTAASELSIKKNHDIYFWIYRGSNYASCSGFLNILEF